MNCVICGKSGSVVMSGVDAFVLGIPTEKICYDCANVYNKVNNFLTNLESVVG